MRYVIFEQEYRRWWRGRGDGYTDALGEAYRYTAEEIDSITWLVQDGSHTILPSPEWYEELPVRIYDEESESYVVTVVGEDGNVTWSENKDEAATFLSKDAREWLPKILQYHIDHDDWDEDSPDLIMEPAPVKLPSALGGHEIKIEIEIDVDRQAKKTSVYDEVLKATKAVRDKKAAAEMTEVVGEKVRWVDDFGNAFMVHAIEGCIPPCPIHARSEHPLRFGRRLLEEATGGFLMWRECQHGVLHPDPDDRIFSASPHLGAHRCDGCCSDD